MCKVCGKLAIKVEVLETETNKKEGAYGAMRVARETPRSIFSIPGAPCQIPGVTIIVQNFGKNSLCNLSLK